jgi:hypothetical protein
LLLFDFSDDVFLNSIRVSMFRMQVRDIQF